MSQAQTRKQKILGDVKRKRQQRAIISVVLAIALVAIIVGAVIALSPKQTLVPLPDYLSHCVNGNLAYHSHPTLTIKISGVSFALPQSPGTFDSGCPQPIHTHDATGTLHVETDVNRDYTLGDWFLLWGHSENNPTRAIFNSTQIFDNKVSTGHNLTMTVNGKSDQSFGTHIFPHNAAPSTSLCVTQPCVNDDIVITYV